MVSDWVKKTSNWFYLTAQIGDLTIYEVLDPEPSKWTPTNIVDWLARNYYEIINKDTDLSYEIDLIEFTLDE